MGTLLVSQFTSLDNITLLCQGPRAQIYRRHMQDVLHNYANLSIRAGSVFDLVFDQSESSTSSWGKVVGVRMGRSESCVPFSRLILTPTDSGEVIPCSQVVICTGTFLSGEIHIGNALSVPHTNNDPRLNHSGMKRFPAGRLNDAPSIGLSASLASAGFKLGRLQTGTPARLDGNTIDFSRMVRQEGDKVPLPFSYLNRKVDNAVRLRSWCMRILLNAHLISYEGQPSRMSSDGYYTCYTSDCKGQHAPQCAYPGD